VWVLAKDEYAGINRYLEPTDDRDLRHALNYAVSQSDLIDNVFQGLGEPARSPIAPVIPWSASDEVRTYDHDPERAEELVEQSSYDGEELELIVSNDVVVGGAQLAEDLQGSFDDVCVNVDIRLTERSAFFNENDHAHISLYHYGSLSAGADYRMYASWHRNGIVNETQYLTKFGTETATTTTSDCRRSWRVMVSTVLNKRPLVNNVAAAAGCRRRDGVATGR